MADAPATFVPDTPSTFVPDEEEKDTTREIAGQPTNFNPAQYIAGGGGMAGISLIPPPGPARTNPMGSYLPETPDIKADTLLGQLAAAPVNVGKHLIEGTVSPVGVATLGLGPIPKLAQGAIGAGFGIPAFVQGVKRVYSGTALGEPQEAIEGALQALTGGLITGGAVHGALAKEAPVSFIPDTEKPPIIAPPKIAEVQPVETAPVNLELPSDKQAVEQTAPSGDAGVPKPSEAPVSAASNQPVAAGEVPQAISETKPVESAKQAETVTSPVTDQPEIPSEALRRLRSKVKKTLTKPFQTGQKDATKGETDNPYVEGSPEASAWNRGVASVKPESALPPLEQSDLETIASNVKDLKNYVSFSEILEKQFGTGSKEQFGWLSQTPYFKNTELADRFLIDPYGDVKEQQKKTKPGPGTIGQTEMGAAGLDEPLPLQTGTGLKNAVGELERVGLGLHDAPETVQRNMAAAWERAGQIEESTPGAGEVLAKALIENPEIGLNDTQSAGLLRHKVDLFNRMNDAAERSHVGSEAERAAAQKQYNDLAAQYGNLLDAVKLRGSEWGREGRWRQAMAKEDFSFSSTEDMNRYRRTLTGEDLPGTKVEEAGKRAKVVKEAQDAADNASVELEKNIRSKINTPPTITIAEAEKRALDAAYKTVREAAVKNADKETVARVDAAKNLDDIRKIQTDAAKKALDAADTVVKRSAKELADAQTKIRTGKTAQERAGARIQAAAARKAVAAADKVHRNAAVALAKAQRELQGNPINRVWSRVREYLDKGETDFDDVRSKVALDLGMSTDQVTRIMAQDVKTKRLMNDAWAKQQRAGALRQNAKTWVRNVDLPGYEKAIRSIPRILFGLKVGFHGTVALGTHAPTVAFQPRFWSTYVRDFGKMYRMVGSPEYYERQAQDLVRRKNYITARRGGLVNDPTVYEDFTSPDTAKYFGNLTGMGNRGYTVLKILRQDMFDQMYNKLPRSLQVQDGVVSALADQINHATGVVKGRAPRGTNLALFAPRLEASRVMQLLGDPARAGDILRRWSTATDGEKLFVKNQIAEKLWVTGTFLSLLALNQGFLSAVGSKQQINVTNPLESDFLKFKVAGHDVAYGSAIVNMAKLPIRLATALMYHGKTSKLVLEDERMGKIALDYVRSQLSPFAGTAADFMIGRDYAGRPLPRAGFGLLPGRTDVPKRLRLHGVTKPYTWTEYSLQQFTPIPVSEGVREVWKYGLGMSDDQISHYIQALGVIGVMAGTGSRVTEDRNMQEQGP